MPESLFVAGRRAPQIPDVDPPRYVMNDAEFLAEIRGLNATPTEILADPGLVQLMLPTLRADTELCETYEYADDAPLPCPIVAFAGIGDEEETVESMKGWRAQTAGNFSLHVLPGDHFFIQSGEPELLNLLRTDMPSK